MKSRHSFGVIWAFGWVDDGIALWQSDRKWKRHVSSHGLPGQRDNYEWWLTDVLCEWFIMKGMWGELKDLIGGWD